MVLGPFGHLVSERGRMVYTKAWFKTHPLRRSQPRASSTSTWGLESTTIGPTFGYLRHLGSGGTWDQESPYVRVSIYSECFVLQGHVIAHQMPSRK